MKKGEAKKALGVDIGNVIIDFRTIDAAHEVTVDEYSAIPAAPGAFEALKKLNEYFSGEVYLISKATGWAQVRIMKWFADNRFFELTGLKPENVHFCGERNQKDAICQNVGVTHFIDDRLEVLSHMVESTPHLYAYRPNPMEVKQFEEFLSAVTVVHSWTEIVEKIVEA